MSHAEVICPSCKHGQARWIGEIPPSNLFAGRALDQVLHGGGLWVCQNCNLYFRWPCLPTNKLDQLYRDGSSETWEGDPLSRTDWRKAEQWLGKNLSPGDCVLDIGCATGDFLSSVLEGKFQKYGIEINVDAAQKAKSTGVNILGSNFAEVVHNYEGKQVFSAITAFDVIEHFPDPLAFLRNCTKLLKPGGRILVSTGNSEALTWRLSGARYWYCTLPEHITFINKNWCNYASQVLELKLEKVYTFAHVRSGFFRRVGELVLNGTSLLSPSLFKTLRRVGFGGKEVKLYPGLIDSPPNWRTAKDHLLVEWKYCK
tara:strand:+ start:2391 stop:3332 length:942 start_codon:yes stop_codon:yes gene_type:complete